MKTSKIKFNRLPYKSLPSVLLIAAILFLTNRSYSQEKQKVIPDGTEGVE